MPCLQSRTTSCARRLEVLDPAPFIYPVFLPLLVALSVSPTFPAAVLLNIVLSISSIPHGRSGLTSSCNDFSQVRWMLSLIPVNFAQRHSLVVSAQLPSTAASSILCDHWIPSPEQLTFLFPLHEVLLILVDGIANTSILPAELQLLCTSFLNLLFLASTPQALIQKSLLWIVGAGIVVACYYVLTWNITLERMPSWRLKRPARDQKRVTLLSINKSSVQNTTLANSTNDTCGKDLSSTNETCNKVLFSGQGEDNKGTKQQDLGTHWSSPPRRHKQVLSVLTQSYMSLTPRQAQMRKSLYALYTYSIVVILIIGVVRPHIGKTALHDNEPLGWAIGYLFGDIPSVRTLVWRHDLENWVNLPEPRFARHGSGEEGLVDRWLLTFGFANARLALFVYWFTIVCVGVLTVVRLGARVEVDTRRKIFHGMMVVMLLPTTYLDPCFLSLALTLVLAVFLLLDLFRAAQLRPISKPLAHFLTPYIDGRDLRGPVIVSPMFLLIGCACPLWLTLSALERTGTSPWNGWDVSTRDVSMVSGVVCVGMGDAAASLIGRRYGRHKWPWQGGKSLEGSAAFAVAVTVGLLIARVWLLVGGWKQLYEDDIELWCKVVAKALLAASVAAFTEAVLTGCNDNVVVPIILWLLVRGLQI